MAVDGKRKSEHINSILNDDDLLAQIVNKVERQNDRRSFSEVCKQWLTVERLNRTSLRVLRPMFPLDLLTKFPNLVDLRTQELTEYPLTDTRFEFIAKTCPKLETVVYCSLSTDVQGDGLSGTKGLRALGIGCPKLSRLMFHGWKVIGDAGVDALIQSAHNLKSLHFSFIVLISDQALRAIGPSSISTLELNICQNVTDVGLGYLSNGSNSKTLKKLILEGCQGITDAGIQHLVNLRGLEHLELGFLNHVTDIGGVAISTIQTLRELRLARVLSMSDHTVLSLADNCHNLEALVLDGIGINVSVTGASIRAFSGHKCLKHLALHDFGNLDKSDVEIVLRCPSLESLMLDESIAGNFRFMHGNSSTRVVKIEPFCVSHPHFMRTVWDMCPFDCIGW